MLSSDNFPTSNMVTAWVFKPGDRFPIIRYAVSLESNKNAIFFLCWDAKLMLEVVEAEERLNDPGSLSGNTNPWSVSVSLSWLSASSTGFSNSLFSSSRRESSSSELSCEVFDLGVFSRVLLLKSLWVLELLMLLPGGKSDGFKCSYLKRETL